MQKCKRPDFGNEEGLKYYTIISMFFLTAILATYVLAYKMIAIGSIVESGGIFIFPFTYCVTDIVAEVYGYDLTKKMIWRAFCCCLVFAIIVPIITLLPAPPDWVHQESFEYVLGNILRFFLANTSGIIVGIFVNSYLMIKWKRRTHGKYFGVRSFGSSAIGEAITSIVADLLAFAGIMPFKSVIKLMVAIYSVKLIYAFLLAYPSALIASFLKAHEGIDYYDQNLKFNPFAALMKNDGELDYAAERRSLD